MVFRLWDRWGISAGILAVVAWIVTLSFISGTPGSGADDQKIGTYFTQHSHQVNSYLAFFFSIVGVLFFLGFLAALRERLLGAEGVPGRLTGLAYAAGIASAVLFVISIVLFTGSGITVNDADHFRLDPNTYRLHQDTAYLFWIAAVIVGALLVWATSAIALRTRLLPRWFGWIGVIAGVIQLFAIIFVPVFAYWGWILVVSALLTWRRPAPVVTTGAVPAP